MTTKTLTDEAREALQAMVTDEWAEKAAKLFEVMGWTYVAAGATDTPAGDRFTPSANYLKKRAMGLANRAQIGSASSSGRIKVSADYEDECIVVSLTIEYDVTDYIGLKADRDEV